MSQTVLVVAAHSDDEALGCAGTLARHAERGDRIGVVFLTNGVSSREHANQKAIRDREGAMLRSLKVLGVSHHTRLDFPDNSLDSVPLLSVTKALETVCKEAGLPDIVYTHHPFDLNVDHQVAHRAALTCFRPQPHCTGRPARILSFEVLSSTGWFGGSDSTAFCPNYFVDISTTLERKLKALQAYAEEMHPFPHARSVIAAEALAKFRGATIGSTAAEAFSVERIIEK
ncbi:PIG-L deacetylase family protein [Roseimaritima sediminicola]|uniref:PIG-L deacetylase family protein n=1 Tax=Roseimaritima sediminicola TaxID=2662066 RepID=UPI0012982AC9|nr:PIG-L deacetylase family protein [Roseimaritima sediminicola]